MSYETPITQPKALPGQELAQLLGGGRGDGEQYWVPIGTGSFTYQGSAVSGAERAVYRRTDQTLPTAWGTAVVYLLE